MFNANNPRLRATWQTVQAVYGQVFFRMPNFISNATLGQQTQTANSNGANTLAKIQSQYYSNFFVFGGADRTVWYPGPGDSVRIRVVVSLLT